MWNIYAFFENRREILLALSVSTHIAWDPSWVEVSSFYFDFFVYQFNSFHILLLVLYFFFQFPVTEQEVLTILKEVHHKCIGLPKKEKNSWGVKESIPFHFVMVQWVWWFSKYMAEETFFRGPSTKVQTLLHLNLIACHIQFALTLL